MICPFRNGVKYDIHKIGDNAVIKNQEEYYPDCYEDECPYYNAYNNVCEAVLKELDN